MWAAIALAIADNRESAANLFIEDCGNYGDGSTPENEVVQFLDKTRHYVTKSMVMCAVDQGVLYSEIFCGYKYRFAPADHVGCALTCAPYVLLAQNAIPANKPASSIIDMTISQWERALKPSLSALNAKKRERRIAS